MKIGITGFTEGIGKAVYEKFQQEGHVSMGFSRSNDFDISREDHRKKICDWVENCDVFINNAFHEWSQVDLLFDMWERWRDQDKIICNIGSSIEYRWQMSMPKTSTRKLAYRTQKRALNDACEHLWNISDSPHVMVVCPCLSDTPSVSKYNDPNKATPSVIADWIYRSIIEKDFKIQRLQLKVNKG